MIAIGHRGSCGDLNSRKTQSKNRSVCENAATDIRGSCRLLVMGSWSRTEWRKSRQCILLSSNCLFINYIWLYALLTCDQASLFLKGRRKKLTPDRMLMRFRPSLQVELSVIRQSGRDLFVWLPVVNWRTGSLQSVRRGFDSVSRLCWFRLQFMIKWKDGEFSLPGLKRNTVELFSFIWACWKASSRTEYCIKIISDDSNSVVMFLRIQTCISHRTPMIFSPLFHKKTRVLCRLRASFIV